MGSESLHFVSARLGTSFLVWLVVGIALALPAGLWLVQINMQAMTEDWQGRPGLSVYFVLEATDTKRRPCSSANLINRIRTPADPGSLDGLQEPKRSVQE